MPDHVSIGGRDIARSEGMSASPRLLRRIGDIEQPRRSLMEAFFSPLVATRRRGLGGWLDSSGPALFPVSAAAKRIVATIGRWRRRGYERRLLAKFSERERHDLGLSRTDVMTEVAKPFWRD